MEGVTDLAFRGVIAKAGRPDLFFTEFTNVSSYASEKGRWNALERLRISKTDSPIIAQIWGKDPAHFSELAHTLESLGFSGVDLNFGCPDKNVNRTGGGAAMIKTPDLAVKCYRNTKKSTNLPVSIKTRLGWSKIEEYKDWLSILLNEHPAALTVHLRTKKEMSKVPAHYELIPEIIKLRNEISPETKLIINGDIKDKTHALDLYQKYPKVDGFMIGRGVFQNPYCFTTHTPTREELLELLNYHLDLYEGLNSVSEGLKLGHESEKSVLEGVRLGQESEMPVLERVRLGLAARSALSKTGIQTQSQPLTTKSYEPLKHYFKIYINNFPGASDIRAKLMETHSLSEAREILKNLDFD